MAQLSLFKMLFKRPKPRARARPQLKRPEPADNAELASLWRTLIENYFPDRRDLLDYRIAWSKRRQRRVLASCNVKHRRVRVAQEMQAPECSEFLAPLLYHELCHAVLGQNLKRLERRTPWHGKEFKALEARHPHSAALTHWIRSGGWAKAVRRARARATWQRRKAA